MLKPITYTSILTVALAAFATAEPIRLPEPAQTMMTGRSDLRALHESSYTGPMRTTLTRENKYPDAGKGDGTIGFRREADDNLTETGISIFEASGRLSVGHNLTLGASVPFVDTDRSGDDEMGIGDIKLHADLLAFQDIFRFPFIIPYLEVALPTGDEDKGLGTGETVITAGISIGTKVYDALTYVIDAAYHVDGAQDFMGDAADIYSLSGSLLWDISDRFAVLAEGRIFEKLDGMSSTPTEALGGLAYSIGRESSFTARGGQSKAGNGETADIVMLDFTLGF
ncbi:MAG: transporter [Kiritimatiellia bacterium]